MRLVVTLAIMLAASACADESQPDQPAADVENSTASNANLPASGPIDVQVAECKHAPDASIYNRPASQWRAEQFGESHLSLTVWRYKDGRPTEFSFSTTRGDNTYRIDTVEGSTKVGEGTLEIVGNGEATAFEIRGKDESGNALNATVKCDKLVPLVAEGG